MRILLVVPNVPSPVRTRPLHIISELSKVHHVSVVCLSTSKTDEQFASNLRRYCQDVEIIKLSRARSFWNCVRYLLSSKPLRCAYFYSPTLRERVRARVESHDIDVVHAEHLKSISVVEDAIGRVPAVLDAVDSIAMFESRRKAVVRNPFAKLLSSLESKRMMHWESKASQMFDRIVISSAIDREQYSAAEGTREKIHVVPNAVDLAHFGFQQYPRRENLLVFCGKLDYFPNSDAALYFARNVWPVLRTRRPELQFEIVGSRPPRSVRELHGKDNIRVVPSVPDVRPYLGRASVALSPIRLRAGTQFKVLEAMALGVPVVATRICCPGLQVEPGKHLLVADTPEEFASAVELILDNDELRTKLVNAGRKFVETHHDWADAVGILCDVYAEAVSDFSKSIGAVATSCPQPEN